MGKSNTDTYIVSKLGIDSVESSDVLTHLRSNNSAKGLARGEPGESFSQQERSCVSKELHTVDTTSYIETRHVVEERGSSDQSVSIELILPPLIFLPSYYGLILPTSFLSKRRFFALSFDYLV